MSIKRVFFVYLGAALPAYATAALKLTRLHSGLHPHLIASSAALKFLPKGIAETTPTEDFYDSSPFVDLKSQVISPHSFRDGFWLKSFERLLVLEQFMRTSKIRSLFHSELDQLLFRVDLLVGNLHHLKPPAISLPFHNSTSAIASIMHVNDCSPLSEVIEFAKSTKPFMNEMELLARWASGNPEKIRALPTLANVLLPESSKLILPVATLDTSITGGISDAAQVGQWIAGADARNLDLSERPLNHFVAPASEMLLSREHLASTRFLFDQDSGSLQAETQDGQLFTVYNLHIHSKAHSWIHSRSQNLSVLIDRANEVAASSVPGVRVAQWRYKVFGAIQTAWNSPQNVKSFLCRTVNKYTRSRPSSAPFLSGDTFRRLTKNIWDSQRRSVHPASISKNALVFLEPEYLPDFEAHVLDKLQVPVTLLIGNSDMNQGDGLVPFINHTMVKRVFAQNLEKELEGAEILPIGIENRWRAANGLLSFFRRKPRSEVKRIFRIMWCFSVQTNLEVRLASAEDLSKCISADKFDYLPRKEHQESLRVYAFVASPPGNGLDTHRTWEAMYQGCVPILLKSYLADSYWKLGLPVWVVDSYSEVAEYTERQLQEKFLELQPRFSSEAMWLDYWETRVREDTKSV